MNRFAFGKESEGDVGYSPAEKISGDTRQTGQDTGFEEDDFNDVAFPKAYGS